MVKDCFRLLFIVPVAAFAQQPPAATHPMITADPQTIVVTGTFQPVPLAEANRAVLSLSTQEQPLLYNSVIDYLHLDPSIDLEQRGIDGTQVDLSIRGATFEQSLVLLNGLRINDAQTGHHDMDIPVPLEAVSRIEVLHGAGSTLYGADALGGAVNFITTPPTATEIRGRIGFGNFGFNQQRVEASYLGSRVSERVAASRDFSTGFQPDRDFRTSSASSETRFKTPLGATDILFAGSDRPFGADQFYGNFNSWERTKSWFASFWQDLGKDTSLAFGYRRHSDIFVLLRDNPAVYQNHHISRSWQAALRRHSSFKNSFSAAYGAEADGDAIHSNNLGRHARNRGAGYFDLDFFSLRRLFLSVGAREEIFSGGRSEFTPALAGGIWLGHGIKLRASGSRAFRLPTYTDLFYSDPANIGNPLLKPESAWSFEAGPEWNPDRRITAQLTAFDRREHNDIDYVRSSPHDPWRATNIEYINFLGVETTARFALPRAQEIWLAYTVLRANQKEQPGVTSKYVFNYPSHNAVFSWIGQFKGVLSVRARVGATQRVGQAAYAIADVGASRSRGSIRPYVQLSNVTNASYQEIRGVAMPGRSVIAGLECVLANRTH